MAGTGYMKPNEHIPTTEMARAFQKAVEAGREAYEIGLAPRRIEAEAMSPLTGFLEK